MLGARVPIILTSRADSLLTRLASCAVAVMVAAARAQVRRRRHPLKEIAMSDGNIRPVLAGQKALVVGVANDQSIAYGCAKAFRTVGRGARDHLAERTRRGPMSSRWRRSSRRRSPAPLDVAVPGQLEAMFDRIRTAWGKLDILVHSIAFAPKEDLQGGLLNCSAEGFAKAMDISCHSFIRMAKLAAPLMTDGGIDVRDELLRRQSCGAELQRDGAGEGRARGGLPLSRLRARAAAASACTPFRPGR